MNLPEKVDYAIALLVENVKRRFADAELYLHGSYARGDWLEDSDVDLIVVSDEFGGIEPAKRIATVRALAPKDVAFEILAYTHKEFEEAKVRSIVIQDASTYWARLL